jgi:PAS domain S-box-containing protein
MSDLRDSSSPTPTPSPPAAALDWLEHSHDLLALTGRDGSISWVNRSFRDTTGLGATPGADLRSLLPVPAATNGRTAHDAMEKALRGEALQDAELEWQTSGGAPLWVRARTLPAASGGIAWILQDITQAVATRQRAERQAELLDMAQEFGRLGIWERHLPSGDGRWDRHVFDFWGLDPNDGTPNFEAAAAQVHPDDQASMQTYRESTARAGRYAQRYRVLRPDGGTRWIHAQWKIENGASGQPERSMGVLMDDTEAFELARSLGDTAEQLTLALELSNIALWRHDLKTNLMHYSDRAYAVLDMPPRPQGIPLDEVRSLIHPDDLPRMLASAQQTLQTGQPTDVEARYRRRDGAWRCIMTRRALQRGPSGEPLAFLGVGLDVTEHRDALAALRSADQRAALAARSAGIGTWEVDMRSGAETWDAQMFALRKLPVCDKPPTPEERMALLHPDDAHLVLDSQRNALSADESSQYEFRVRLPGGVDRWLASRSIPVRDEQGHTVRRVGVNWDVTESRNAQAALQEKARAESESEAKSQFLARMSHELRTPLNAVLGFTQLLQQDAGASLSDEQKSQLGHIRMAGEHLLSLINDALELSSLETGKLKLELQAIDLRAAAAQALPLVEPLARRQQVRLLRRDDALAGGSGAVLAWADPTRVLQVLLNLLSNAVKYNRSQGEVIVCAYTRDGAARLRVTDTGRGMTPEQISHLFEPFNRLGVENEGIEGTGIGLVIVKALVESMGGSLGVTSQAGRGTSFELSFPPPAPGVPDGAAAPTQAITARAEDHPLQRKGQVLYIEDNAVNVLLVQELVRRLPGLALVCESTGQAGVLRAASLRPDLVLLDMQLPDFDGFEVLKRLRRRPETAHIPCIALSANAMPDDITRAMGAGFEDYWTKPIDFKAFIAALAQRFPLVPAQPLA